MRRGGQKCSPFFYPGETKETEVLLVQFALTYAPDIYDTRTRLMGRQLAGIGILKAALQANPERIWCYAASRASAETFGRDARALSQKLPELRFIPWDQPGRLAEASTL